MYRSPHHWHLAHLFLSALFVVLNAQAWLSAEGRTSDAKYSPGDLPLAEFERWTLVASAAYFTLTVCGEVYAPSALTIWTRNSIYETLVFPTAMLVVIAQFKGVEAIVNPGNVDRYPIYKHKGFYLLAGNLFEHLAVYHGNRDIVGDVFRTLFWGVAFGSTLYLQYAEVASFNSIGVVVAHYIGGSLAMMLLSRLITAAIWDAPYRWFTPGGDGGDDDLVAASNGEDDASGLFSDDEGPAASQGATKATKKTKRTRKQSVEEQEADEVLARQLQDAEIPKELQIDGTGMKYSPQKERLRRRPART
jgi:hypothetical protein